VNTVDARAGGEQGGGFGGLRAPELGQRDGPNGRVDEALGALGLPVADEHQDDAPGGDRHPIQAGEDRGRGH